MPLYLQRVARASYIAIVFSQMVVLERLALR